jgi:hypothetical protein
VLVQQPGHRRDACVVLCVRPPEVAGDEVFVVAEAPRLLEHLAGGAQPVAEDGHPLAEHVLLDDLERRAGRGQAFGHRVHVSRARPR